MKKLLTISVFVLFLFSSSSFAQLAKDSWGFGFGFSYPRLVEYGNTTTPGYSNTTPMMDGAGGYLTIQRNMTEHVSWRLMGFYNHISYNYFENTNMYYGTQYGNTNIFGGNLDLLYYFVPCESVSPYATIGFGGYYFAMDNPPNEATENDDNLDYRLTLGIGAEWDISENWAVTTELDYHTVPNSRLSGDYGISTAGGLLGGPYETYMTFNLGLIYTFSKGEPSKICQLYEGINVDVPEIDYERIENIVKKHIPKEVVKEVVVPQEKEGTKWVLVGVNFDFNKATLRPESYPILFNAVQVLSANPGMRVEIQGHTDAIASEEYNMKLGQRRAETVKDYLVSKGIDADRLVTKSYGESQPVATNDTAAGRALNRRVEFKVLNQ